MFNNIKKYKVFNQFVFPIKLNIKNTFNPNNIKTITIKNQINQQQIQQNIKNIIKNMNNNIHKNNIINFNDHEKNANEYIIFIMNSCVIVFGLGLFIYNKINNINSSIMFIFH